MSRFVFVFALLLVVAAAPWRALAAPASLVVDVGTGRTLQSSNADLSHAPASLTKMMTLYLLFDQVRRGKMKLTTTIPISRYAASMAPTKLGLPPGSRITVRDAILALVTKSANDVAVAVAEAVAGNEQAFAKQMTRKARALGMRRTTFANASGLPNSRQKTTARDMATLARALMRDHPRFYPLFSTRLFVHRTGRYRNHNGLLFTYKGVDGVKTGYTNAAGYNLVASAKRGKIRLIGVVLGSSSSASRQQRMTRLLDDGFRKAEVSRAVTAKKSVKKSTSRASRDVRKTKRRSSGKAVASSRRQRTTIAATPQRPKKEYARSAGREQVMLGRPSARPNGNRAAPPS